MTLLSADQTDDQDDFEALAVAAAGGSAPALSALYERYTDDVYRYLIRRTGNHTVTEDAHGEVWMKVCRSIRSYDSNGHGFPSWLFTIAKNVLRDHYRSAMRSKETPTASMLLLDCAADAPGPEDRALSDETSGVVSAAVESLPKKLAECVTLRFFHRLSVAETASVMGTSEGNVRIIQHRALRKLNKLLPESHAQRHAASIIEKGASDVRTPTDSSHRR